MVVTWGSEGEKIGSHYSMGKFSAWKDEKFLDSVMAAQQYECN